MKKTNEPADIKRKLWKYSVKDLRTGCRLWSKSERRGYGAVRWEGKIRYAHRLSYQAHNGPIPDGAVIHHMCGQRLCINPNHLQAITPAENTAEMNERQHYLRTIAQLEAKVQRLEEEKNVEG
jgi:hypothetical protein